MRRPPSYSDSFIVLSPRYKINYEEELLEVAETETETETERAPEVNLEADSCSCTKIALLFAFKGSFHILCISIFETTFYFLYVNRSEDAGIFNTINTYYNPLIEDCSLHWTNGTKWLVSEVLGNSVNKTAIDAAGAAAYVKRSTYNETLILHSSLYSLACFILCSTIVAIFLWKKWPVSWTKVCVENLLFIGVLAGYEFFFYNTIIYNYATLSTAELNKYIVDGLATCTRAQ